VDPTSRNAPLVHVVYAGADLGANQRQVFMKLLQKVTVPGVVQGTRETAIRSNRKAG
jgi:ABC-type spermidine/putrescine transport system permease subunit I